MEQLFDWKSTLERETLLTEAYFGETSGVQKLQTAITKFRDKFASKKYAHSPYTGESKELDDICTALEDEFGFGTALVTISPTVAANAMTMPVGMMHDSGDPSKFVKKTKDGYKYDKSANYASLFIIWGGLIFNREKFTDREVCAILLHEVGHNFSTAINKRMAPLARINRWLNILCIYPLLDFTRYNFSIDKIDKAIKDLYKKNPGVMRAVSEIRYFINMYQDLFTEFSIASALGNMGVSTTIRVVLQNILNKVVAIVRAPGDVLHLLYGYNDEKFADGFATMYGYGPELHSAMDKISEFPFDDYIIGHWMNKDASILAAYFNIMLFPAMLVIQSIDEHPSEMERLYASIRVLETEISSADPKRRKRIQKDIDTMKKQLDDYYIHYEKMRKDRIVDPAFMKRSYYGFLAQVIGGDFRHHIFDRLFNHEYYLSSKGDKEQ